MNLRGAFTRAASVALGALVLMACWDSASLRVSASDLAEGDAGPADASVDAPPPLEASVDTPDAPACLPPLALCGPVCTDLSSDPFNCGSCGISCAVPPPPTCNGSVAVGFAPGLCAASTCSFPEQSVDCGAMNRVCFAGGCAGCAPGFQDNDLDGSCVPDCATTSLTCDTHGTCSDATGTPACVCDPGFEGALCETNIDECALFPCLNGGQCVDGVADRTCNCVDGFTGLSCELPPPPSFLWLDATDPTTLTIGAGDKVSEWRDKSGLGRNAVVPGGSEAPVFTPNVANGAPAIFFDGSTVRLQTAAVPTSAEMTIFVVFNMVSPQTWGSLINQAHDTYFSIRKSDCCGGGGNLNFHIQNNNAAPLLPITLNTWKVLTAIREGTTSTMYYAPDAATTFVGDTLTGGVDIPITIGNAQAVGESMGGYIAEVRAYATPLGPVARGAIEAELKTKYAVP